LFWLMSSQSLSSDIFTSSFHLIACILQHGHGTNHLKNVMRS
jgi:hypothetical protein